MTQAEILAEIERKQAELAEVKGTRCEVYSRCVGYFRPVRDWNPGKQQEFSERVVFDVKGGG